MNQKELQRRIGQRIREARESKGMSREQLEGASGLGSRFIGSIERGENIPSLKALLKLANALQVDPAHFFHAPNLKVPHRADKREKATQRLIAWCSEADMKSIDLLSRIAEVIDK